LENLRGKEVKKVIPNERRKRNYGVTVREKKPGEWWVFINHHGKRTSKKVGGDKRLALDAAKKIEAKLVLADYNLAEKEKTPTFK